MTSDWAIVRPLATGGFGEVFEAVHRSTGQRAAIKILHGHLAISPEMEINRARFEREVRLVASLAHPNIVRVLDAGTMPDGRPFFAMEMVDGESLAALVEKRGPLAPEEMIAILEPLCDALSAAHAHGIVHRDLKADNVVVEPSGRVVLLDFGIAKVVGALTAELTATGEAVGTPAWMAPEQIRGEPLDARTDIYALGCLAFHLATAQPPFRDPSPTMTQYLHLHARRPLATSIAPALPGRFSDAIARAMAIAPDDRYTDPFELLAAVRAALRETDAITAVIATVTCGIEVSVYDTTAGANLDAQLLDDLESVLPAAERYLASRGFALALDLGTSAQFVGDGDPESIAVALRAMLETRPTRDPRVRVTVESRVL